MRTGDQLLVDFSIFLEDYWASATDAAGSSDGASLVDSAIAEYGDDTLEGGYVRITESGHASIYSVKRVSRFDADPAALIVRSPYSATIASGVSYEFHRYDPRRKMQALNRARILAFPQISLLLMDETRTGDGHNRRLTLPSTLRTGPVQAWGEYPLDVNQSWNFLPQTGWSAGSGSTVATYTHNDNDLVLPRRQSTCNIWTVTGSAETLLSLTASALLHNATAASFAGRRVTVGVWAYCRTANRLSLRVTDDAGVHDGAASHQGLGWEFITVTFDVSPINATLFTTALVVSASTADIVVGVEDAYGIIGEQIPIEYTYALTQRGAWRDAVNGVLLLDEVPLRGQQIQLIGRRPITNMGNTHELQSTASLEVDEQMQELLFAKAARLLYIGMGLRTGQIDEQFPKILETEQRFKEMAPNWEVRLPYTDSVKVW